MESFNERKRPPSVALYWDFENLHAGLVEAKFGEGHYAKADTRFKPQEPLVDVQTIVDLAASYGPVAVNRAYGNWQFYGRYRDALLHGAVELVQLFPPGASAKNGADIKLCLDAVEDVGRLAHVGTVVIVGGDSDFMPLAQKIKAMGRTVIGIGTRRNTNRHWARSCDAFRFYDGPAGVDAADAAPTAGSGDPAADLLRRAVRLLSETRGDTWVDEASVRGLMKRLEPSFEPREHGQAGFAEMLQGLSTVVESRAGAGGSELRLR